MEREAVIFTRAERRAMQESCILPHFQEESKVGLTRRVSALKRKLREDVRLTHAMAAAHFQTMCTSFMKIALVITVATTPHARSA